MHNYGVSRKRMYPRPKLTEKAGKVAPKHNASSFEMSRAEVPNYRKLNEARQREWRIKHGAVV
jgi:hypothetical protein